MLDRYTVYSPNCTVSFTSLVVHFLNFSDYRYQAPFLCSVGPYELLNVFRTNNGISFFVPRRRQC